MKRKSKQDTKAKKCMCSKCGATARAIADTTHRRCPGAEGLAIKPKSCGIPVAQRGKWM